MLFGARVLPMVGLLATLAGWPLLLPQQPRQPQPTVSPSRATGIGSRVDRRPDGPAGDADGGRAPESDWEG